MNPSKYDFKLAFIGSIKHSHFKYFVNYLIHSFTTIYNFALNGNKFVIQLLLHSSTHAPDRRYSIDSFPTACVNFQSFKLIEMLKYKQSCYIFS